MNQRTAKLINKVAKKRRVKSRKLKHKWYDLNRKQRTEKRIEYQNELEATDG